MSGSFPTPNLSPAQVNFAWTEILNGLIRQALNDVRVSVPAIVLAFNANQTVRVQVAIREIVRTTNGPQNTEIALIDNVPIVLPSAGGFSLTLPIKPGDEGMLVFCDVCIDLWWQRGGVQNQFERRRHDISDCGFYPGAKSQPNIISNYSTNSAQLRSDDGTVVIDLAETGITLTGPKITLNSPDVEINSSGPVNVSGTQIKLTSSGNDTQIDTKTFLTHEHTGVTTGTGKTGPVF